MRWPVILLALLLAGCGDQRAIPASGRPVVSGWVKVTGQSMLPNFPESAYAQAAIGYPYDQLKAGDSVIFWDYNRGANAMTHHRLVQKQGDSWIAKGDNPLTNPTADRSWVTRDNYYVKTTGVWAYELR